LPLTFDRRPFVLPIHRDDFDIYHRH
jgi:hypothetical protein